MQTIRENRRTTAPRQREHDPARIRCTTCGCCLTMDQVWPAPEYWRQALCEECYGNFEDY